MSKTDTRAPHECPRAPADAVAADVCGCLETCERVSEALTREGVTRCPADRTAAERFEAFERLTNMASTHLDRARSGGGPGGDVHRRRFRVALCAMHVLADGGPFGEDAMEPVPAC